MSLLSEALAAIRGENNLKKDPFINENLVAGQEYPQPRVLRAIVKTSNLNPDRSTQLQINRALAKRRSGRGLTPQETALLALYHREPGL